MATITLKVEGSTVGVLTAVTTLDQAQGDRLLAFLATAHGTKMVDGQPVQRTPQEMVQAYWDGIIQGTITNVVRAEENAAIASAKSAVPPFVIE